jgi:hypothetical protein
MKLKPALSVALCILFSLLLSQPGHAAASTTEDGKERAAKKANKAKMTSSRNNSSVKIYPDPLKRIMHIASKQNKGKDIEFFVFDLSGTLVRHYKMTSKDHEKITGLERGKYVYNVFCGDEETAAGEFEIR